MVSDLVMITIYCEQFLSMGGILIDLTTVK